MQPYGFARSGVRYQEAVGRWVSTASGWAFEPDAPYIVQFPLSPRMNEQNRKWLRDVLGLGHPVDSTK